MKSYAFVRSNVPRAMRMTAGNSTVPEKQTLPDVDEKNNSIETITDACPSFSSYLYFLFVPTLVYRDNYPRFVKTCYFLPKKCFYSIWFLLKLLKLNLFNQGLRTSIGTTYSQIVRILSAVYSTRTTCSSDFAYLNSVTSTLNISHCRHSFNRHSTAYCLEGFWFLLVRYFSIKCIFYY